jgi:hypothetical protein
MKKTLPYFLFFLVLNSVGQKYFDLSKAKASKPKSFTLKPKTITSPTTYTTNEFEFVFDKSEIIAFIDDLKQFEKFKLFGFDSLKTVTLTTKNDTVQFNQFANAFDDQIILRFIHDLVMKQKTAILIDHKQNFPKIKTVVVSQDMRGCIWTGYIIYINDKYFFDDVTSQARTLD